jgi:hypothetical protein
MDVSHDGKVFVDNLQNGGSVTSESACNAAAVAAVKL